ncbi:ataxin-8-like [Schistocerca serialis cubense]|uniref:ataxin-8-like n=1 Tax=Schistocerca serialis cubense TaxID=2023355 RepID=UPI00214F30A2|nr:ataxin-8-like [Schistocerca serialis cubense]
MEMAALKEENQKLRIETRPTQLTFAALLAGDPVAKPKNRVEEQIELAKGKQSCSQRRKELGRRVRPATRSLSPSQQRSRQQQRSSQQQQQQQQRQPPPRPRPRQQQQQQQQLRRSSPPPSPSPSIADGDATVF